MKKIIFSILFAFIFTLPLAAHAGVPEAVTYLKTQTLDDWIGQALVAAGESIDPAPLKTFSGSSATDYAKRIMALVAAGKNPTSYTGTDLVAGLKSFEQTGQIGDATLTNDDAWGIMALSSIGTPASDQLIKSSAQFLINSQNADGGWSWKVGFDSDTNDTAAVLMALADAGYTISDTVIQEAVAYLASQQNSDAGFPYQLPCPWPSCEASDSASTAWSISALNKLGLNAASWTKGGDSPQDFLLTLQTGDGSFKWQASDPVGSPAMTAYSLVALSNKSYPVKRGNYLGGNGSGPTPMADLAINFVENSVNIIAGEQAGLTVKLKNHGPTMAQNVVAELTLPEGMEIIQAQTSGGSFDAENKQWTFIRFNNYAAEDLSLIVKAAASLMGEVKISVAAPELDIDTSNNEAVMSVVVRATEPVQTSEPEAAGEVLGETSYGCEAVFPAESSAKWLGHVVSYSASPWYVDPVSELPYCLSDSQVAYSALGKFGLGITNENLAKIPIGDGEPVTVDSAVVDSALVARLKGRILLQVESLGEAWYVNPFDNKRYYLANGAEALRRLAGWQVTILP